MHHRNNILELTVPDDIPAHFSEKRRDESRQRVWCFFFKRNWQRI